jgi:hypothetical protein
VVGIGELDNHDTVKRLLGLNLSIFPFARVFRLVRTHILTPSPLTGDSQADIATLLSALDAGRAYVALDHHRSASGFALTLTEDGRSATMGDEFRLERRAELTVSLPHKARIRIIRNGVPLHEAAQRELTVTIREPGAYRIEAALRILGRCRPWIFSNPIYVRKS